ncbi:MAG: prolipoprotein diacylglyceryl transferase [Butyricicoccus sp.]|nr:prolipoprotein diacylglyceryl transferase [Butyricicoccus sp.]
MQQVVSFPGLGLEFHLSNIAFHIASKPIYWYGILIMCGVILAVVYASRRCSAFGIKQDDMYDCVLFAVPLGIVCARIYYVIFEWEQYKNDLSEVFAIWHGGLAIYGGILGGIVVVAAVCRFKKIELMDMLDVFAAAVPIGQILGRWGNFFNCEAYGGATTVPWRMVIGKTLAEAGATGNHPTFFYESAWNLVGFLILYVVSKKRKYRGEITLLYLGWYGLGRFFIEGLRTDSLYLWGTGIRVSQVVALICVIIGLGGFFLNRKMPFLKDAAHNSKHKEETA